MSDPLAYMDKAPTEEMYLRRAQMAHAQLEFHESRSMRIRGKSLPPDGAAHRFLGRMMWRNLMGWAGFPMWLGRDS